MKKAALFLTSLVSLSLLLSACQPEDKDLAKDPAVADKCPRCKIKGESQSKQQKTTMSGIGYFAFSAILMEKEVEAVQLARLALDVDDLATAGFSVEGTRSNELINLVSDGLSKNFDTDLGPFKTTVKKSFSAVPADVATGLGVSIDAVNFLQSVNRRDQRMFIDWTESKYSLKLVQSTNSNDELGLTLQSSGSVVLGTPTAISASVPFQLSVVMRIRSNSFKSGVVQVLAAEGSITYVVRGKSTTVKVSGENHEIAYNGKCYSLTGESTMLTDRNKKKMVYKDSSAQVPESSFKTPAAACESRPTVDLSRGFVY